MTLTYENYKTYGELKREYENESFANHFKYIADIAFEGQPPVLLYYNGENHYSTVLPIKNDIEPLVPKSQILDPIFDRKNEKIKEFQGIFKL